MQHALTERNLKLIDLMTPAPDYLCITGGEPTLLEDRLLTIVAKLRDTVPCTYVHMLTNGRRFAWADFASRFAAVRHPNLSLGIPLYADHAALHDYIVQARDAFDQTILGLHQLARHGVETEIRVVLHALTIPRLTHLAEYICRNLTFVDHVAFMGMEHIGYAPRNMNELWIDPVDYQEQLEGSVDFLARFGIEVRIYNLQLCVLKDLFGSIRNNPFPIGKTPTPKYVKTALSEISVAGFFQWNTKVQSRGIHTIAASERSSIGFTAFIYFHAAKMLDPQTNRCDRLHSRYRYTISFCVHYRENRKPPDISSGQPVNCKLPVQHTGTSHVDCPAANPAPRAWSDVEEQ